MLWLMFHATDAEKSCSKLDAMGCNSVWCLAMESDGANRVIGCNAVQLGLQRDVFFFFAFFFVNIYIYSIYIYIYTCAYLRVLLCLHVVRPACLVGTQVSRASAAFASSSLLCCLGCPLSRQCLLFLKLRKKAPKHCCRCGIVYLQAVLLSPDLFVKYANLSSSINYNERAVPYSSFSSEVPQSAQSCKASEDAASFRGPHQHGA